MRRINLRHIWLQLIQREDLKDKKPTSHFVCENHFDSGSILSSKNRKTLKKTSVPKLLLPDVKYEDKGTQITVQTTESCTMYELICQSNSSSQTPMYLNNDTPRKRKLKQQIDECIKRIKITAKHNNIETEGDTFSRLCDKFLTKNLANVVKEQAKLKFHSTGNRYSEEYKMFCLNLYYVSPQAYNLLQNTLCLPSKTSLKRMHLPIYTNVDNYLMQVLKKRVEKMTDMERHCSLVIKAMSIKTNLFYSIKEDKIYGFHEIDGIQSPEPAKYALVAMISGIFKDYKQPVGYALLAECKNYDSVSEWIDKLIGKLFEIGLNVRIMVSNMDSDFYENAKTRLISIDKTYFHINDRKIYYIFDAPHLIKVLCNNLMNYDFCFENHVAKWDHILQFYQKDKTKQLRVAPKLTESHMRSSNFEKMKVKYAVQVLSATVAAGISVYKDFGALDQSAEGTIQFIKNINNLFDLLNSSSRHGKTEYQNAFCGEEYQINFLNSMLNFFSSLKLISPKTNKDVTSKVKFIEGFQITLKSLLLLFEDLKVEGYTYILTTRLNHDCLENFFDQVRTRNGNSAEPTSWQLVSAFREIFLLNILKQSNKGNCADDLAEMLVKCEDLYKSADSINKVDQQIANRDKQESMIDDNDKIPAVKTTDYEELDIPEKNALVYVSGYLLNKCFVQHRCDLVVSYMKEDERVQNYLQDTRYSRYKNYCNEGGEKLLTIPQDDFIQFVETMEVIFCDFFKQKHINCKILWEMLRLLKHLKFAMPCKCFPLAYCKKLYLRMRIYYSIKYNNRAFRQSLNRRKYFSVSSL